MSHESERLADQALQRLSPQSTSVALVEPANLLAIALQRGADLETLERLMALKERHEANEARKAYVDAMAEFKQNPPTILKEKRVSFQTSKGVTEYNHATLGSVCAAIGEGLSRVGISHDWDVKQPDGGMIEVTCTLTHKLGHSKSVTLKAGRDDSGGKNAIQQVASTVTYLQRYTLLAAAGVATNDIPDDDGLGYATPDPISADQAATIDAKLDELGGEKAKRVSQLLTYLRKAFKCDAEALAQIPAKLYPDVINIITAQLKAQEAKRKTP